MAEYIIGKAVVRIHGEVDQKRIEQACLTYLANTKPVKPTSKKEARNDG